MATYVVGDIQGCLQPLKVLLKQVAFNTDRDMLWSVGDIVNRGPKCLKTLRYFYERRDNLRMVLGNHDLHLLGTAARVKSLTRQDTLGKILAAPDRDILLSWLRSQPLLYQEHGVTIVHAGIPPQWTVQEAAGYAREVEAALRGENYVEFLRQMYGNLPNVWSEDLTGYDRLRLITNYLTRMRYCTKKGRLDLVSKGPLSRPGGPAAGNKKITAWFNHPERKSADDRILFGHWASLLGRTETANVIGLDTGCVWGGYMSLYCLDTGEWARCKCTNGRCRKPPEKGSDPFSGGEAVVTEPVLLPE